MRIRLVLGCLLLGAVPARPAAAQDFHAAPEVPAAVKALPPAGKGDVLGTLINGSNAEQYRRIIVPELYGEVRGGRIEMDAVRELRYEWRMDEAWQEAETLPAKLIDGRGALQPGVRLERGFLFGGKDELNQEEHNPHMAQRMLWNIHAAFWSQKVITADFWLRRLSASKLSRELRGVIWRAYPSSLIPDDRTGQLFREIIRLDSPDVLKGYAWLTFRFLGADEDAIYVYSPAIRKTRELTGSNRSDAVANAGVSADDLWVWSGKPDAAQPTLTGKTIALAPFAAVVLGAVRPAGEFCVLMDDTAARADQPAGPRWNVGSGRFVQAAPWLPTEAVFAPRELWRLELVSNDPFSLYGRQVLYVDAESMLPVYKFVYDQAGLHWKTVMGVLGLAEGRDGKRFPYMTQEMVNDVKAKQSFLLDYINVRYCRQFPAGMQLADFQPGRLGPAQPAKPPQPQGGAKPASSRQTAPSAAPSPEEAPLPED